MQKNQLIKYLALIIAFVVGIGISSWFAGNQAMKKANKEFDKQLKINKKIEDSLITVIQHREKQFAKQAEVTLKFDSLLVIEQSKRIRAQKEAKLAKQKLEMEIAKLTNKELEEQIIKEYEDL